MQAKLQDELQGIMWSDCDLGNQNKCGYNTFCTEKNGFATVYRLYSSSKNPEDYKRWIIDDDAGMVDYNPYVSSIPSVHPLFQKHVSFETLEDGDIHDYRGTLWDPWLFSNQQNSNQNPNFELNSEISINGESMFFDISTKFLYPEDGYDDISGETLDYSQMDGSINHNVRLFSADVLLGKVKLNIKGAGALSILLPAQQGNHVHNFDPIELISKYTGAWCNKSKFTRNLLTYT